MLKQDKHVVSVLLHYKQGEAHGKHDGMVVLFYIIFVENVFDGQDSTHSDRLEFSVRYWCL